MERQMSEKAEQKQRFCRTCGDEIRPDTRFCVRCGTSLNPQARASDESKGTAAKKSMLGVGSQTHKEDANPPERNAPAEPSEQEGTQASTDNVVPKLGIFSHVKNFGRENKLIAAAIPVFALLLAALGTISDFSVLVGLWNDEKTSNAPAYIGIDVKDYSPALSSFDCGGGAECLRASENEELKSKLSTEGALNVVEVAQNGPAAEGGVLAGDIVTGIDGYRLASSVEFSTIMEEYHPGDTVRLFLYRESKDGYLERESVRVELQ